MITLEMSTETIYTPESLTQRQLEAVKNRAIQIWGEDKWLTELSKAFEKAVGANPRTRATMVSRWFKEGVNPNLDSFNGLLLAVGCEMAINRPTIERIL